MKDEFPWRDYINEKCLKAALRPGFEVVVLDPYISPERCQALKVYQIIGYDLNRTKHPSDLIGAPKIGVRRKADPQLKLDL